MKKFNLLLLALLVTTLSIGQDETLFDNAEIKVGGFGALHLNLSTVNDELSLFSGGGGGIVLNDFFIGGYGLNSKINNTPVLNNTPVGFENYDINLAYGGIWMGYSIMDRKVVHPFVSLKTGLGNVSVLELNDDDAFIRENVFVVTPEVGVEVNLTRWIKLVGAVNYRTLSGMDDTNFMESSDFNALGGGLTIRYGYFGDWDF